MSLIYFPEPAVSVWNLHRLEQKRLLSLRKTGFIFNSLKRTLNYSGLKELTLFSDMHLLLSK